MAKQSTEDAKRAPGREARSGEAAGRTSACAPHGAWACHMCHNGPGGPDFRFPTAGDVEAVAQAFGETTAPGEQRRFVVSVSPGTVAVGSRQRERAPISEAKEYVPRGSITAWSRKSRARMARRLAELDYNPLFADPTRLPAMVTLTLPADFRTCTPDGETFKRQVKAFRRRWEREWGPMTGVWKLEFQSRGAPHLHILVSPPSSPNFHQWLSSTWASVVAHPDPDEREAHRLAGTNVDYGKGLRNRDPRRVAVYFSKHGLLTGKDYQNRVPDNWEKVGRFWGYWNLAPAVAEAEVSPDEAVAIARLLRRHARTGPSTLQTWERVNVTTGEVQSLRRYRRTYRDKRRLAHGAGFVCVNDGPMLASEVGRYINWLRRNEQLPH